jgi:hypothetical protein
MKTQSFRPNSRGFYSNNCTNVQVMRNCGYKVSVEHGRCWNDGNGVPSHTAISKKELASYPDRTYVGRDAIGNPEWIDDWNGVSQFGGYTKIKVTSPGGLTVTGKYNVKNGDRFNRHKGIMIALGQCVKQLLAKCKCESCIPVDE